MPDQNPLDFHAPRGFCFAAAAAGIRKGGAPDVGLIVSDRPALAAAAFTRNRVAAAPVELSRAHLRAARGRARAIVVNAGNANCATSNGARVAKRTAETAAKLLGAPARQVLVASTGVIGVPLGELLIPRALPSLVAGLAPERFTEVAAAILTTDTRPKLAFRETGAACILGMAKGAGMIHPQMATLTATMLAFVLTDAAISVARLRRMTASAVKHTFNRISVDGDTSTNDTVFVLANGASGKVSERLFGEALEAVMSELAVAIAADGEGAKRLVIIDVAGARTEADAERIARAVANSPLVKTAVAGGDPNWGRILSAAGNSGALFEPARVKISMNGVAVCRRGQATEFEELALNANLRLAREVHIRLDVGRGPGKVRFWTCDLTEDYIRINASYRT